MAVLGAETIMEVFGGPGGESGGKKGEKEIRKGEKEMKKGEKEEKELFEELGEAKRKPLVPLVLIENEKSENAESARRGLSGVRTAAGARLRATDEIMKVLCERKSDPFSSKTTNENKIIHKLPFNSAKFHQKSPKSSPNSFSDAAAIFEIPKPADDSVNPRFVLAADGIRYASNLGLLLHLAFFLEIDFLFFVSGGVDPFNWKVISRSKGLHLLLPFAQGPPEALLEFCKKKKLILIAADLQGPPLEELKERISGEACEGICCVLGGESKGPSSLLKDNSLKFALPMAPFVESLNVGVAGGLALSLLRPLALARSFEKFQKKFQDAQKGTF